MLQRGRGNLLLHTGGRFVHLTKNGQRKLSSYEKKKQKRKWWGNEGRKKI